MYQLAFTYGYSHYFIVTVPIITSIIDKAMCGILGSHGSEDADCGLLGCHVTQCCSWLATYHIAFIFNDVTTHSTTNREVMKHCNTRCCLHTDIKDICSFAIQKHAEFSASVTQNQPDTVLASFKILV
jgi:hypothetical protein